MVIFGVGMTGLFLSGSESRLSSNIILRNQALVVAEAGIERARQILNFMPPGNPNWVPHIAQLLQGSHPSDGDEIPISADECTGQKITGASTGVVQKRGALLVDTETHGCSTSNPCLLRKTQYPVLVAYKETITNVGAPEKSSMGHYTVYIRQDQADCRMNNFTCDYAPLPISTDGGVADAATLPCTAPMGAPTPNGNLVVHSEGVASDNLTRVVLEVTLSPSQALTVQTNTTISGLCATGANGCEDNSGVYNGVTVNSPIQYGGATASGGMGGSTSAGGSTSSGGSTSIGGSTTSGGTTSTGGNTYSGGSTMTGGSTASSGGSPAICLNYAVVANTECIIINADTLVDSYQASLGPYGGGNVGTKGDVRMASSSSACLNNCGTGCITGTKTFSSPSGYDASTMPEPTPVPAGINVTVPANRTLTPAGSILHIANMTINTGGTLTLNTGYYVVDYLNFNLGSTLVIKGPVRMWIRNPPSLNGTVTVQGDNPKDFWLIYNGTGDINNNSPTTFYGVIFAPRANMFLNYCLYGAIVTGKITLNSQAKVHYDIGLGC
jgi:hypothetical protein